MQEKILINGLEIFQPDSGNLSYNFETTYTEDSTRTQDGIAHFTPLFTVEQFGYSASHVPVGEVSKILQQVVGKEFELTCYSPYYGTWRTSRFQVGKGSMSVGTLEENRETIDKLSFNMQGVYPL